MFSEKIADGWVVLIVDDHYDNLTVAQTTLEYFGAEVHIACDGQEGLDLIENVRPTVILLDLSMPVMTGWEMFEHLRNNPDTADIPIVAVTAHVMDNERFRVLNMGFDGYISKPYDVMQLAEQVKAILAQRHILPGD